VDTSVVGYDGARNVRDEEHLVGRKKLVRKAEPPAKRGIAWPRWTGFRGMTLRSWLELLVVPLALVVIGFLFSVQQDARQQRIEDQRAAAERELAEQRAQDEALQAYLDQMSNLLLENDLRESKEDSEVRTLARARTLTVLGRLDPNRKTALTQFLVEAELVQRVDGRDPIISLRGADLSGANLFLANLSGAVLEDADLSGANLSFAFLRNANLSGADLLGANLLGATLRGANLRRAVLREATLEDADLRNADLRNADLRNADLNGAYNITNEELLRQAAYLKGATMP
jgi:uncharacterized protein YjbI with pentapeptide repeats